MKIPTFGVTQHFADEVDWILYLTVGVRLPRSMMITVLTTLLVADMYSCKFSWGFGATRVGVVVRYFFNSLKATCASGVHWNLSYFLRSLKKGSPLTSSHEINLLKAAMEALEQLHFGDSRHLL
jgi:hypothetical protein